MGDLVKRSHLATWYGACVGKSLCGEVKNSSEEYTPALSLLPTNSEQVIRIYRAAQYALDAEPHEEQP
jgi:hypothetical protein